MALFPDHCVGSLRAGHGIRPRLESADHSARLA
jgi:hypothetical protein